MMWWPFGVTMEWWMIVWIVIFWGGLIALIVWGIKRLTEKSSSNPRHNPLEIAKERYAKGDISREEFEQIKKYLSQLSA